MDLPSVLGGLAQGFVDFGKSAVDLFGTGGAAFADLIQGTGTKNQDDFRKWLYQTDSVKDAAAKGLGTALNGVQTVSDYIPGINVLTRNPLGNAAQGALGGLADEFKMAGENYDLGRAGQRAAVSGAAALAGSSLGDALKKSASPLLRSGLAQGLARGAAGGAINQGGYAAIDGGDVMQGALQGAGLGALIGGATGAVQDFIPRKQTYRPETLDDVLAAEDMAINSPKPTSDINIMAEYIPDEGFTYDYDGSDMAAVQRAYNLATQDQVKLDGMLKEISDTLGTDFESAGQKSVESMLNKIERKVRAGKDYTVSSMKDHTRGKVMMHNFSEIPQVLQELDRRGVPYDTEVVTNDWGYKGYHITYRNPDGISSEIQLTTADHWPAKLESDAIYDKWRNFNLGTASKTERQRYNDAMAKSQALWAKVDFNEFDKAVQSLSDTGRASRSVAPVTSKLGLTQEPSLYTKTPSPSESANMSPSSVTRTFSGTGFDKSPNINKTPFNDIIPQNTSRTLEGTLSNADMAVNNVPEVMASRIAPGQLGLFDDLPTQTPKTGTRQTSLFDQPQEGLEYYGGDIEAPDPGDVNPYAPVNGQITQEMQDRAAEILKNYKKGIPENELYNAINQDTLPTAIKGAKTLDMDGLKSMTRDIFGVDDIKKADLGKVVQYAFSDEPGLARYYMGYVQSESPKSSLYKRVQKSAIKAANKKMAGEMVQQLLDDATINNDNLLEIKRYTPSDHAIRSGYTAAADEALSERLGIAPGNTPKYNGPMDTRRAYGRYSHPTYGPGGDLAIFERKMANPEDAVSTIAHERLHSFQGETEMRNSGRYNKEVIDAYKELQNDLKDHYKTWEETAKRYGNWRTGYWQRTGEQESRMLQNYLENKGYTKAPHMSDNIRRGEWGNEINPAFDKFFDKLRDLSKRGVALPALAGLVGGGAVLDQILNSKEEDKKKTKRSA